MIIEGDVRRIGIGGGGGLIGKKPLYKQDGLVTSDIDILDCSCIA